MSSSFDLEHCRHENSILYEGRQFSNATRSISEVGSSSQIRNKKLCEKYNRYRGANKILNSQKYVAHVFVRKFYDNHMIVNHTNR